MHDHEEQQDHTRPHKAIQGHTRPYKAIHVDPHTRQTRQFNFAPIAIGTLWTSFWLIGTFFDPLHIFCSHGQFLFDFWNFIPCQEQQEQQSFFRTFEQSSRSKMWKVNWPTAAAFYSSPYVIFMQEIDIIDIISNISFPKLSEKKARVLIGFLWR